MTTTQPHTALPSHIPVIIGGGLQGLLALETLTERGYACALVHDGPLGAGQTLHSRGFRALLELYPSLLDVSGLRLGCYAGYRQDIRDELGRAMCEMVEGTANVLLALPSGIVAAWLNAARIAEIARSLVAPRGAQPQLAGDGIGVEVGCAVEDRADFPWLAPDEWSRAYSEHARASLLSTAP